MLKGVEINEVKIVFVNEVIVMCCGVVVVIMVSSIVVVIFVGGLGDDLFSYVIVIDVIGIVDVLIVLKFVSLKGEVCCLIVGGGVWIDGEKVIDELVFIVSGVEFVKVLVGKKLYGLIVW